MKYVKMLGLAAVAAAALMAFVGASSASATTLTCTNPPGTKVTCPTGTVIDASAESSLTLRAGFANITCTESTVKGKTTNEGGLSETVKGTIEVLTFGNCGSSTVDVIKKGTLEIHTDGVNPDNNGTLTGSGSEVTVQAAGVTCTYATNNTDLGTLTGSTTRGGSTATFDINAELTKSAGGFLCANPAHWEGSYLVTEPDWLDVD